MKKKLLVTGASGFLGWNICRLAVEQYEVIALCNRHDAAYPGVSSVSVDLTDAIETAALIRRIRPDAIIHAAADSLPDHCHIHPVPAYLINVEATRTLARLASEYDMRFLFTSTDMVFPGNGGAPYAEEALVNPINRYGLQKSEAERLVLSLESNALVCRMPLMFGDSSPSYVNFIAPLFRALRDGQKVKLFTDQIRTPVSGTAAAEGLLHLLDSGATGILHLGGREHVSRYEFGLRLAKFLGASEKLVGKDVMATKTFDAQRPIDACLDSAKAYAMGYSPLTLEEEFARLEDLKWSDV